MRRFPSLLGLAAAAIAVAVAPASLAQSAPPVAAPADAEPPEYPPPSARWGVAGAGLATTALAYGAGFGLSYVYPDTPGMKDLRTPIVGPWIGMVNNGCTPNEDCSQVLVAIRTVLMALDGAAQAAGLAVVLEGLFMPTQQAPASPAGEPRAPNAPPPKKPAPGGSDKNLFFVPTPMNVGAGGVGIGVVGRF